MATPKPTLLIVASDATLSAAFARCFERDGWDVVVVTSVKDAEHAAVRLRPNVLMLHTACTLDPAAEVKRLRALPTLLRTRIVVLADRAHMPGITAAHAAGAAEYLLVGHTVPGDVVARMKQLIEV